MSLGRFLPTLVVLTLLPAAARAAEPDGPGIKWTVDRQSVMVGGCLTINIDTNGLNTHNVVVYLDGERVDRLAFLGPEVRAAGKTVVLLWWNPSKLCPSPGNAKGQRACPLFGEPGSVELRLEGSGVAPGSVVIKVREIEEEAKPALDLLFPEVEPRAEDQGERVRWVAVLGCAEGYTCGNDVLKRSYPVAELQTIVRHPDWAEVMPAIDALRQYEVPRRACFKSLRDKQSEPEERKRNTQAMETAREHVRGIRTDSPFARAVLASAKARIARDDTERQSIERHR